MLSVWWLRKKNVILQAKTENEDMEDNGVMQAAEPTVAYGANSYASVMCLLHNLSITPEVKEQVGRRLMLEVTSKYLSKAFDRLDHLSQLGKNWDGEGALPISCKVINNVKSVLAISEDDDWRNWMIGPDTNATLGLQSKVTDACISIGADEYSYYADINGREYNGSNVKFTPSALLHLMREIG